MGFAVRSGHKLAPPEKSPHWYQHSEHETQDERRAAEKALVRKIDRRLLPILVLMLILNYIDRNALPQARRQGLEQDLGLLGNQYNTVLSLTFVGYIVGQVPSNMVMSNISRPSIYLSVAMIVWGIVSAASGATQGFADIATCRFLLGLCEAPFFSGVAFLFSGWYTRKEIGKRLAIFFSGSMIAGAFAGIFSAGVFAAFENSSIASWRIMFWIEGSATVLVAVCVIFVIPDWPATTKWLTEKEKALALSRLQQDAGDDENTDITTRQALKLAVRDYRVWLCIMGQVSMQAVASLTNFLPTLVAQFGYSSEVTLLLTAPPYAAAAGYSILASFWSDRQSKRSPFIIFPTIAAMIGIIITLATEDAAVRYAALFLMLPGTYGCFQISNAWMANIAARPAKKRGIALALNNGIGNSALIWTPYLYDASMEPGFTLAWSVNLGLLAVLLVSTVTLSIVLRQANERQRGGLPETTLVEQELQPPTYTPAPAAWWALGKQVMVARNGTIEGNGRVIDRFDT